MIIKPDSGIKLGIKPLYSEKLMNRPFEWEKTVKPLVESIFSANAMSDKWTASNWTETIHGIGNFCCQNSFESLIDALHFLWIKAAKEHTLILLLNLAGNIHCCIQ